MSNGSANSSAGLSETELHLVTKFWSEPRAAFVICSWKFKNYLKTNLSHQVSHGIVPIVLVSYSKLWGVGVGYGIAVYILVVACCLAGQTVMKRK